MKFFSHVFRLALRAKECVRRGENARYIDERERERSIVGRFVYLRRTIGRNRLYDNVFFMCGWCVSTLEVEIIICIICNAKG